MEPAKTPMIVFYDGLCGFCDHTVQFVLERDRGRDRFLFAPLQGNLAEEVLPRHGKNPKDLNSLYLLADQGLESERVFEKSSAAIRIGKTLGGLTGFWANLASLFPRFLRDWGYGLIAKARYRIFGKREACRIPAKEDRAKFIGL